MRIFKCPNCKDVRNKTDDIVMVQCPCGYKMIWVDENHKPVDIRNEAERICDENKCATCPIRGVKCF